MRTSWSKARRSESGQAAVLIAILCGVLVVAVAMTTNLGKVVTEKMAMQDAADLAAYSGAATEAKYLNEMRDKNEDIWKELHDRRENFKTSDPETTDFEFNDPALTGCGCPEAAAAGPITAPAAEMLREETIMKVNADYMQIVSKNMEGYSKGQEAARDAADANYSGTKDKVQFFNDQSGGGMITIKRAKVQLSYRGWCILECGPVYEMPIPSAFATHADEDVDGWVYKDDKGNAMVGVGIKNASPVSPFMDFSNYFQQPGDCEFGSYNGSTKRCALDVYALAEPFHGKMGSIPDKAMWEMVITYNYPGPMIVDTDTLDEQEVERKHYHDYKVRFVGIFENDARLAGSGTLAKDKVEYGDQMAH